MYDHDNVHMTLIIKPQTDAMHAEILPRLKKQKGYIAKWLSTQIFW